MGPGRQLVAHVLTPLGRRLAVVCAQLLVHLGAPSRPSAATAPPGADLGPGCHRQLAPVKAGP